MVRYEEKPWVDFLNLNKKFKNLSTTDLLNVVDELSVKPNPPDGAGTVDTKISKDVWKSMDMKEKRSNWSAILDSYKR